MPTLYCGINGKLKKNFEFKLSKFNTLMATNSTINCEENMYLNGGQYFFVIDVNKKKKCKK